MPPSILKVRGFEAYMDCFQRKDRSPESQREVSVDWDYVDAIDDDTWYKFSALDNDPKAIDTGLETVLALYYASGVVKIQPVEAERVLPHNRASEVKIATAVYRHWQEVKFLDPQNRDRIGRYELEFRTLQKKNNITQTEIETGIRSLISDIVDEEFNKVSFFIANTIRQQDSSYGGVLTRNPQNGHYTLRYESKTQNINKELTAQTPKALLDAMRNSKDFSPDAINFVETQTVLIPAVVYADWKAKGIAGGVDALALVTETLTNFYLNPSQATYNNLLGIIARYNYLKVREQDIFAGITQDSLVGVIDTLNPALMSKITQDIRTGNVAVLARVPNDPRYNIFSTPYSIGGK